MFPSRFRFRFSILAIAAAFVPLAFYADDPGAGGGGGGGNTDPAKPAPLTQADIDKAVSAAVAKKDAEWTDQFKRVTGAESLSAWQEAEAKRKGEEGKLIDQLKSEKADLEGRFHQTLIGAELRGASGEALDPDVIVALLGGKATVKDGAVLVDGKPAKDAVAELLKAKPHLAKAGQPGGGAPAGGGGNQTTKSRAEFEALDPKARMDFINKGGKVV